MDFTEYLVRREPVVVRRRVLWGECDPAGVVYTPRFADYVAAARDWFTREALGFSDRPHPSRKVVTFPMRAMSFEFLSFLAADDIFDMTVAVAGISPRTFTIKVTGAHVGRAETAFVALLTNVCFDQAEGRSATIPDPIRAALTTYQKNTA